MNFFNIFFTTKIPEDMRFSSFSPQHLALIFAVGLCVFFVSGHIDESEPESAQKAVLRFSLALPCIYLVKFVVFWLLDVMVEPQMNLMDRLPFHLCAMNAIIMPIAVLKRNKLLMNYMYAVALPASVAAMITPAMSYYGRYFYLSWQVLFFYIDHGLMALIPILAIRAKLMRPDIKMLPRILAVFAAYSVCIFFLNKALNQNFMFLNYPDEGTVMAFFAEFAGNPGYLFPLTLLAAAIVSMMYLPWALPGGRHQEKNNQ